MSTPDFVAQNGEPMTVEERRAWFDARHDDARARGCTWAQLSVDDADNPTLALFEGWKVRPKEQPEPHFQMTHASNG